jgi:hypothetical protein
MNSEARNRRTTLAPTPEVACLALPFVFMLFLGTPVLALNANDLRNNLVQIPRFSPVSASKYFVDGLALGGQVKSGNLAHQEYQCRPSDKFSGFIWCHEEHTRPDNSVMRSHSILQSQDGTAYYVNSYFQPAFFDPNDIQNEIDRMSSEFGQQARIIQMSQREGLPSAVMAIWGAIQLEPLKPDEISVVASGGSPPGILVSFLGDEERSAKAGVAVYRLVGGAGFLWVATFDRTGRGVLQYLAIDDSKIEPPGQVASNSENQFPYILFDDLGMLYVMSGIFGLFHGGLIPMYAVIVREYFSPHEAGARVGIVIGATLLGMALGGWMSGAIFDLTGSYRATFINAVIWNLFNLIILLWLLSRRRRTRVFGAEAFSG